MQTCWEIKRSFEQKIIIVIDWKYKNFATNHLNGHTYLQTFKFDNKFEHFLYESIRILSLNLFVNEKFHCISKRPNMIQNGKPLTSIGYSNIKSYKCLNFAILLECIVSLVLKMASACTQWHKTGSNVKVFNKLQT